jgi:hypothetical protein
MGRKDSVLAGAGVCINSKLTVLLLVVAAEGFFISGFSDGIMDLSGGSR